MNRDPLPLLAALREFDTGTICNVIELFGCRAYTDGYADPRLRAVRPDLPPSSAGRWGLPRRLR